MIVLSYWIGTRRVGMLAWQERNGELPAVGGLEPADCGFNSVSPPEGATTVVTTDEYERVLAGWPHPQEIMETGNSAEPSDWPGVVTVDDSRWEPVPA